MVKPKSKYDISIIIPTYNRSELLDYSLASLTRQDIDRDRFEVVIADDGSVDDTLEVIKKFKDLLNLQYLFQEDKGYRPGSARNMGIRSAQGDICLFIDSGVILNINCLGEHIRFHATKGPNVSAIGYVYGFDRTKESEEMLRELVDPYEPCQSINKLAEYEIFWDVRDAHYVTYSDRIHELPAPWYYFWTCHLSVARTDLMAVGLFDEGYDGRWGIEDNDLGYRLHKHGIAIHLLRSAEAMHYPHQKDKEERRLEGLQNCNYFHKKFQTLETSLYLDNYMNSSEFVDINKLILQIRVSDKVV